LLNKVMEDVLVFPDVIYLHSQSRAVNLYKRDNFIIEGEKFYEAGIEHYNMIFRRD
jgi:predicted GNAT family N-acyltransferase